MLPGGLAGVQHSGGWRQRLGQLSGPGVAGAVGRARGLYPLLAGRAQYQSRLRLAASGGICRRGCSKRARIWAWRLTAMRTGRLFVSHSGKIVDGDAVLLLTALPLQASGRLTEVVATVMSNLGLERALKQHGIGLVRTAVGDKYVLEEMLRRNAPLGGEQSGHIIFRDYATTGDGLLTALRVLDAMRGSGKNLDELTAEMTTYPQLLVNVRVRERRPLKRAGNRHRRDSPHGIRVRRCRPRAGALLRNRASGAGDGGGSGARPGGISRPRHRRRDPRRDRRAAAGVGGRTGYLPTRCWTSRLFSWQMYSINSPFSREG